MQARRPPGTAKELAICDIHNDTFDVTQCIAEHLLKGKPVLQLAANRCQATRRCVERVLELAANATMSSAMPQKSSCPVVWPAPKKALPRIQGEQEVHLLLPGPPRNREELEGGCLRSRSIQTVENLATRTKWRVSSNCR